MSIPFKSKLTRFRNIKNRNKAFDKLTNRQKRQEIAFDALGLLSSNKIGAERGLYWNMRLKVKQWGSGTAEKFQEELCNLDDVQGCKCCARGAIMLSTIRLGNKVEPSNKFARDGGISTVKGFTVEDMRKMEQQFEYGAHNDTFSSYNKEDENLANILCNVIKNGNYKPDDKKNYIELWNINL